MLSTKKMTSGGEDYYLRLAGYYQRRGRRVAPGGIGDEDPSDDFGPDDFDIAPELPSEPAGQWLGSGCIELGLSGIVFPDELRSLMQGLHPRTREPLVQNSAAVNRVPGWDFTFSDPKSVSIVWTQADDLLRARIESLRQKALHRTIGLLEKRLSYSRVGKGGYGHVRVKLIIAGFEHCTSRNQDPQLHTHCLVLNVAADAIGHTRALFSRPLYVNRDLLGAFYRAALAGELGKVGFRLRKHGKSFEIVGVPQELIDAHSSRRQEIVAHLRNNGRSGGKAAAIAALDTRKSKTDLPPRDELIARWQERNTQYGFTDVNSIIFDPKRIRQGTAAKAIDAAINRLVARATSINVQTRSNTLVSAAIVVAALYFGRDILLPFALAVLLSFLLAPLVERLEKWKFGRIPAVLTVVAVAFLSFSALAFVLAHQVYDLAYRLPDYKENIIAKAQTFQGDGTGVLSRITKSFGEMRATLSAGSDETTPGAPVSSENPTDDLDASSENDAQPTLLDEGAAVAKKPVPVEVVEALSAKEIAQGILGPLISPLASAAMVIVFVVFMLLKREDLRNRLIHLIGGEQLNITTQALNDAARRVSRYLLMQLIINSAYGLVISIGLALIGLPNAPLWGALTTMLRFVPYVGPWIAALMPIAISLAVFDGWLQPALVVSLFVVNELISNNIIEPWLYGSSTGISTIGILASAVFWAWIWGPVGLVMATPLTVCLTVLGKYVPQLAFFNTMLSDQDVLPPQSRFYQRLLALDPEEAMEVAEDYLAASSLTELYDVVLLPALSLAEQDRHRGALDEEKQRFVHQTTREIVEELGERISKTASDNNKALGATSLRADSTSQKASILCLPARDEADEIAGLMLAQLLEQRGVSARVASTQALSGEMIEQVTAESIAVVCVSALPPLAATHARYLCKRLRPNLPRLKLIVGLWQTGAITTKTQERLTATGIDKLVTTLNEAAIELERLSQNAVAAPVSDTAVRAD